MSDDPLRPLEQFTRRLQRCTGYEEVALEVLRALDDLFGFRHSVLFALDPPTARPFALASSGDGLSGVGAHIAVGLGLIGTAASRRRMVVQASLAPPRAVAAVAGATAPAGGGRAIRPPGLAGERGAAAIPLILGEAVLGVLYLESEQSGAFGAATERLLQIVGIHTAAMLAAHGGPVGEDARTVRSSRPVPSIVSPLQLVYYQADDTVLCDSEYIVKGAPGRILWSMLQAHADTGRTQFSNRELRLDETLGLPAGSDNLESRLLVLRRRLAHLHCGITLERVGRGRLQLTLDRPSELTVVPTAGPMRVAHERK